jgi:serine protease AprX
VFQKTQGAVVRKTNLFLNIIVALSIVMMLLGTTTYAASADDDPPRADPALLQLAAEHPDEIFMIIIQREAKNKELGDENPEQEPKDKESDQEAEDETPEAMLEKAGGKVKKQLDIIQSFSAEITGKEIEKLARHPQVRWISFDAPLVSTAASDPKVRDEFSASSFANNNGSQNWASNWTESNDTNSPGSGNIVIANGSLQLKAGNRSIKRQANLSGAVYAAFSFQYKRNSFDDANDYVAVQVSTNGGYTWSELGRYQGPGTDSAWQTATFYLQNYAASNTQVRFATSSSLGTTDILYVDNVQVEYASASKYAAAIRADQAWLADLKGLGVTVAVVDSGITSHNDLLDFGNGPSCVLASTNQTSEASANDGYGHGTFVAGIIGGNGTLSGGTYSGIAPWVNLVNVKVSNQQGMSTASDLIDGLQWINNNRSAYNIRVVNLSLNSTVAESYHTSPLDAAVEILWFNGIVVVVSAGNNGTGSGPVTLYPPANDPFVITVGASEDKGTAALSDDTIASFSAYGTTENNYAKPDLVAPGRHVVSLLASTSAYAYINHSSHRVDNNYFRMSGTSMSAPMVSGAAAILLQDEPNLNPDQVKYRLMSTANKNWTGYNAAAAGAGYLDVYAAVSGTTTGAANTGILPSQLLSTGSTPISWGSVGWNSVGWNSVGWNSVGWNTVGWNTVGWNASVWDN